MAAGGQIEFIAMPWANDMALLAKPQAGAFLVRRDHFFDLVENLALTDWTAGVGANVFVSQNFAAGAKDADLELVDCKYPIVAVGDVGQFANLHLLHPRSPFQVIPFKSCRSSHAVQVMPRRRSRTGVAT